MRDPMMEITPRSKLFDVLNAYPQLEEIIIGIAPPFKNLKNPILRRTVGQLATVGQVAQIGSMEPIELVNRLRREVGQPELRAAAPIAVDLDGTKGADDPDWIRQPPQFVIDGIELLARGEVPLNYVNETLGVLSPGRTLLLVTDFEPLPIFDAMRHQGRRFYHKTNPQDPRQYLTFIG